MRLFLSLLYITSALAKLGTSINGRRKLPVSTLSDDFSDEATTLAQWIQSANPDHIDSIVFSSGELVLTPSTASTNGFYANGNGIAFTKAIE